jgi:hypothetical protein
MRDDFDSLVADRFKVLDDVPVPDTWSRVLDRVPVADTWSRVPFADHETMIDLETPVPTEPRRKGPPRVLAAGLLAAAAVIAIVLVATRDDAVNPADEPAPTVTVLPTPPPRALFGTEGEWFEPGTYFVDEVDGTPTARIFVTIGAGWQYTDTNSDLRILVKHSLGNAAGSIAFSRPDRVFSDACHWSDAYHPVPVTTLDGLVAALSEQGGWADVTAPSDISIDGYPGKTFQRTAPAPAVMSDCSTTTYKPRWWPEPRPGSWPAFRSWQNAYEGFVGGFYEPGQIETLLVLDIDGTVVVINARPFPEASAAARAEFAAVLDSIRIDRG